MRARMIRIALTVALCATFVPISAGGAFARSIDGEFPVAMQDWGQVQPAIDYPYVVYKTEGETDQEFTDIWAYNIETGQTFPICLAPGEQSNPSVYDGKVVYSDDRNDPEGLVSTDCNIYMYDINTGLESVVASNTEGEGNPFIWGNRVLFNHWNEDGDGDVHMVDISTGVESTVCADAGDQYEATVWEDYAAWRDRETGSDDVALYDFTTHTKEIIADSSAMSNLYYYDPMVGDGVVVYSRQHYTGSFWERSIQMYDIESGVESTISAPIGATNRWHPEVKDGWVVWPDNRSGKVEVWGYNLESAEETCLVAASSDPTKYAGRATTGSGWLAWHDHRDEGINNDVTSYDDLYMKWLGEGPAPTQAMPLQGATRYETAVEVSKQSFPDGADSVVIATGENWPDALAGASFAGAVGAPILLVGDATLDMCAKDLPQAVADEIERLGASSAYILGGEKAIAAGVQSDIESITGGDAMRFAGMDRYETACVVASETVDALGAGWDGTAFATTGRNWPDALAAAPLAAFAGYPVFLADADGMSDDTEACMDELGVTGTIVLGGTVAMPLSVTAQMQSLGIVEIDRVGGDTRYETAALISQFGVDELGMSFDTLGISTGTRFPDALASGAALGQEGFTTMLTPGTYLHAATMAALESNADDISQIRYAGGMNAVGAAVRAAISNCLK